jgi:hypothetical protein
VRLSPDCTKLLVYTKQGPFSYLVPSSRFAVDVDVWRMADGLDGVVDAVPVFKLPVAESIPIGFDNRR